MDHVAVIPCLDVKDGRVVKGVNFVDLVDAGDPVALAAAYDKAGADEIVLLDITATTEDRPTMREVATKVKQAISVPFIVGGGMHTLEDVTRMLEAGADKVSLNSAAVADPDLIDRIVERFGSERLVVAIDVRAFPSTGTAPQEGPWEVMTHGGTRGTGRDACMWAAEVARRGAGAILVTSMDCDGVKGGYDIALTRAISRASGLPVIASGGAGKLADFVEAVKDGEASGVLAASVFHFGTFSVAQVKEALLAAGIPVRAIEATDFDCHEAGRE